MVNSFPNVCISPLSDSAAEAERLGISREHAADYLADERGTEVVYHAMSAAIGLARAAEPSAPLSNTDSFAGNYTLTLNSDAALASVSEPSAISPRSNTSSSPSSSMVTVCSS